MSSTNFKMKKPALINHASGPSLAIDAQKQLKRLVLANMLFEDQFYIDGKSTAGMVASLVSKVDPDKVAEIAIDARSKYKLRHVPLLLCRELARIGKLKAETLTSVVSRPDEIGEFISLYWKEKKQPLSNQVKKGLAQAFSKFNEYQFAKWNKNSAAVKLRDALFLVHAKPVGDAQTELFKKIAEDSMKTPDTWETELSAGADKKATFTRLMQEKKLGAMAFLRNLRNMTTAGVDESMIRAYAESVNVDRILPFRYIAAARIVPQFEDMLEAMMFRSLATMEKLPGKTVLLVDVSPSMFGTKVSEKSDLDRFDAAAALAMLCAEICEDVAVYSFSTQVVRVAPRKGFALREAIMNSQPRNGTLMGKAVTAVNQVGYDRLIVISDEESQDRVPNPIGNKGYILNVASYKNGVNSSAWTTVSGWSEACIQYITEIEKV